MTSGVCTSLNKGRIEPISPQPNFCQSLWFWTAIPVAKRSEFRSVYGVLISGSSRTALSYVLLRIFFWVSFLHVFFGIHPRRQGQWEPTCTDPTPPAWVYFNGWLCLGNWFFPSKGYSAHLVIQVLWFACRRSCVALCHLDSRCGSYALCGEAGGVFQYQHGLRE